MDKLGDIELFVSVVDNNGLAAAGRELGLSPASVTAKISRLEKYYGVRLLNRTTRTIALTDEGKEYYQRCLRILSDISDAEEQLLTGKNTLSGPLTVTASEDLGQNVIAPLLSKFTSENPGISAHLYLSDGVLNMLENSVDLAIRYGALRDSRMVAQKLASSRRMLCASPAYIKKHGTPKTPDDLADHRCLGLVRLGQPMSNWYFKANDTEQMVTITPHISSTNGAVIRQWTIDGHGIALKSYWDIKNDLNNKKLLPVLENYTCDFEPDGVYSGADLNVVYPSRDFLPERTRAFISLLLTHFSD